MLYLDKKPVNIEQFPDHTLLFKHNFSYGIKGHITWLYENETELVSLIYLVKHLKANFCEHINLFMPYIPNARQDSVKSSNDVFTLKYFAEIINSLGFRSVTVLDPHSSVSEALINYINVRSPKKYIENAYAEISKAHKEPPIVFYPDEGACKRYSGMISAPFAFGIKKKNWEDGKILGLDISGDLSLIQDKNILIVDDICSKGGTFYHAAKRLKELGAKDIYLFVTHCENTILIEELTYCGYLKEVYTTNSIFTKEHPLIHVTNLLAEV